MVSEHRPIIISTITVNLSTTSTPDIYQSLYHPNLLHKIESSTLLTAEALRNFQFLYTIVTIQNTLLPIHSNSKSPFLEGVPGLSAVDIDADLCD